jgi:hypothetical protein
MRIPGNAKLCIRRKWATKSRKKRKSHHVRMGWFTKRFAHNKQPKRYGQIV